MERLESEYVMIERKEIEEIKEMGAQKEKEYKEPILLENHFTEES